MASRIVLLDLWWPIEKSDANIQTSINQNYSKKEKQTFIKVLKYTSMKLSIVKYWLFKMEKVFTAPDLGQQTRLGQCPRTGSDSFAGTQSSMYGHMLPLDAFRLYIHH